MTTSRQITSLLEHALSGKEVKGPSSGGKSYIAQRVLDHFHESAYSARTGMSERALAYSTEPLKVLGFPRGCSIG